jgi:hypothetical protein
VSGQAQDWNGSRAVPERNVGDAEPLRQDRRCVAGFLREKREHGGVDPDYATVIFGGAEVAVSKMQLRCSTKCWPREK